MIKYVFKFLQEFVFLSFVFVSIWLLTAFVIKGVDFCRFNKEAEGHVVNWGVLPLDKGDNRICVDYSFDAQGQVFYSQYVYEKPFGTEEDAKFMVDQIKSDFVTVYYCEKDNVLLSVLERKFPRQELLFLFLILCSFVTFKLSGRKFRLFSKFF